MKQQDNEDLRKCPPFILTKSIVLEIMNYIIFILLIR